MWVLQVDGAGDLPDEAMPDAMHISTFMPPVAQQPASAGLAAPAGAAVALPGAVAAGLQRAPQPSAPAELAGPSAAAAAGPSEVAAASSAPATAELAAKLLVVDEPGPEAHEQHPSGGQQQEAGRAETAPPTAAAAAAELQQALPFGMNDDGAPAVPPTASAAAAELRQVLPFKVEASPAVSSSGAGQSMEGDGGPNEAAEPAQGALEPPPDVGMEPEAAVLATAHTAGQGTQQSAAAQQQPSPLAQPQPSLSAADMGSAALPEASPIKQGASPVKHEASPVKQELQHEAPGTSQPPQAAGIKTGPQAAELSGSRPQQVEAVGAPGAGRQMLYPQPCEELDASDAEGTDKVSTGDQCPCREGNAPHEECAGQEGFPCELRRLSCRGACTRGAEGNDEVSRTQT